MDPSQRDMSATHPRLLFELHPRLPQVALTCKLSIKSRSVWLFFFISWLFVSQIFFIFFLLYIFFPPQTPQKTVSSSTILSHLSKHSAVKKNKTKVSSINILNVTRFNVSRCLYYECLSIVAQKKKESFYSAAFIDLYLQVVHFDCHFFFST